ncbi:MAG: hypothetical protein ABEI31_06870 [Halodesulfurarchaeum sp.]
MEPVEWAKRAGVFVVVLVIVVGALAAGPMAAQPQPPEMTDVTVESFSPDTIVAQEPAQTGTVSMSADASGEVIVVDMAHQNDVSTEQLEPLLSTLTANGATIRLLTSDMARGQTFNETLRKADAFVSIGAQEPFTTEQINGLKAFGEGGGRILLMTEPKQLVTGLLFRPIQPSQPAPYVSLSSQFGLTFGNGYLYNMQEYANNYRNIYATPASSHSLTADLSRTVHLEATTVEGGQPLLTGLENTALSSTRKQGAFPVAATSGNVTAVGDTTFISTSGLRRGDNEVFVGNLLDFLVEGEKLEGVPKEPQPEGEQPSDGGSERPPQPP